MISRLVRVCMLFFLLDSSMGEASTHAFWSVTVFGSFLSPSCGVVQCTVHQCGTAAEILCDFSVHPRRTFRLVVRSPPQNHTRKWRDDDVHMHATSACTDCMPLHRLSLSSDFLRVCVAHSEGPSFFAKIVLVFVQGVCFCSLSATGDLFLFTRRRATLFAKHIIVQRKCVC